MLGAVEEKAVFGEVVAGPPYCHVVEWVLEVAVLEVSVLDDVLEAVKIVVVGIEDVLSCSGHVFQHWIDEVEMQVVVVLMERMERLSSNSIY